MTALAVDVNAVTVVHINTEEIKLVARLATCASTHTNKGHWVSADIPIGHVKLVHVLFDNVVARELSEVEPVTSHIVGIALPRLTRGNPRHSAIPGNHTAHNITNGACIDLSLRFQILLFVAALRASDDSEALTLRKFTDFNNLTRAHWVDRDGLLDEAMFT